MTDSAVRMRIEFTIDVGVDDHTGAIAAAARITAGVFAESFGRVPRDLTVTIEEVEHLDQPARREDA